MAMASTMARARMGQMPSAEQKTPQTDDRARLCPTLTYLVDGNMLSNRAPTTSQQLSVDGDFPFHP